MNGLLDLNGRVALVTGGNSGVGLGLARALAGAFIHSHSTVAAAWHAFS